MCICDFAPQRLKLTFLNIFSRSTGPNLIKEVLIQSRSTGAKIFTKYVFCHPQFSGVVQNIENHCAILTPVYLCQLLSKKSIL